MPSCPRSATNYRPPPPVTLPQQPPSTMKRCSTPDQTISSFKRVKISTSPGELRLDRDIECLLHSSKWAPSKENNPPHQHGRLIELCRHNATLIRDAVDPLRMKLIVWHGSRERWTFFLQLPRMYPHVPPVVSRVSREILPESGVYDVSASAVMVASSVMQRGEPPVPEKVLVRSLPPSRAGECVDNMDCASHEDGLWEIDSATSVYRQWSPVSSLEELIDFLITIPERRRQWWSVESNRRAHLQSMRSCSMTPVMQNLSMQSAVQTMQYSNQIMCSPKRCQKEPQMQHTQFPSSPCDMEAESLEAIEHSPFIANRFDVGYERGAMMRHHWGVR